MGPPEDAETTIADGNDLEDKSTCAGASRRETKRDEDEERRWYTPGIVRQQLRTAAPTNGSSEQVCRTGRSPPSQRDRSRVMTIITSLHDDMDGCTDGPPAPWRR